MEWRSQQFMFGDEIGYQLVQEDRNKTALEQFLQRAYVRKTQQKFNIEKMLTQMPYQ